MVSELRVAHNEIGRVPIHGGRPENVSGNMHVQRVLLFDHHHLLVSVPSSFSSIQIEYSELLQRCSIHLVSHQSSVLELQVLWRCFWLYAQIYVDHHFFFYIFCRSDCRRTYPLRIHCFNHGSSSLILADTFISPLVNFDVILMDRPTMLECLSKMTRFPDSSRDYL
jgi:hypothetical protein